MAFPFMLSRMHNMQQQQLAEGFTTSPSAPNENGQPHWRVAPSFKCSPRHTWNGTDMERGMDTQHFGTITNTAQSTFEHANAHTQVVSAGNEIRQMKSAPVLCVCHREMLTMLLHTGLDAQQHTAGRKQHPQPISRAYAAVNLCARYFHSTQACGHCSSSSCCWQVQKTP